MASSFLPSRIKMELEHQASCPNVMVWRRKNLLQSQFVLIKSEQSQRQNAFKLKQKEIENETSEKRTLSQWKKAVNQPLSLRTILAENFPIINHQTKEGTSTQKFLNSKSLPKISFVDETNSKKIHEHNSILAKKQQSTKKIVDQYDISSITHSTDTFHYDNREGSLETFSENQYSCRKPILLKKCHQHQKSTAVQNINFDYGYTEQSKELPHKSKLHSPNVPRSQYWKSSNSIVIENLLNPDQKHNPNNIKKKEEQITVADQNSIHQMQDELELRRKSLIKKQQTYQEFYKGNKHQFNKSQKPLGIGNLFKLPKQEPVMSAVKERYSGENEGSFIQGSKLMGMSCKANQITGSPYQIMTRPECLLQRNQSKNVSQSKPSFASQLQEAITRNLRGLKVNEESLIRCETINPSFNTIIQPTTFMQKRREATEQGARKGMGVQKGAASFSNIDLSKIHTQQQFFKAVKEIQKTKETNQIRDSQQKILKNLFINNVSKPQLTNQDSDMRYTLRDNYQVNNRSLAEREEQAFQAMMDSTGFDIEPWNDQPEQQQQQLIPIAETKETYTATTQSYNVTRQTHLKSNQILYGQQQLSSQSKQSRHITPSNSASQIVTQPGSKLKQRYQCY